VYRAYLLIFLLLCACKADPPVEVIPDYGDVYFYIGCYWPNPAEVLQPAIWRCFENVETELLSGFLYLELENSNSLYFCGENLTLRSGIGMYDNLITYLTNNKYDCLHITEDKEEGNAFDWFWEESINTLQIIWRPDDEVHKMITLVIKNEEYNQVVRSVVYYKTLP
jgi:hypothetical protein